MKKVVSLILTVIFSALCISFPLADEQNVAEDNISPLADNETILAFPGAEGAGKYATGGRGGKVYHVTNLNDSGAGSFRDAVSGSNRIVVFDVGGTIELKSDVVVKGNITIAGQTAPGGGGITLKNYKLGMGGDNIIIRFVSSRPGPGGKSNDYDGWGGANGSVSMIDHCSVGWATDEQYALYSNNMYQTVQWSVIGPSNSWGGHPKGAHGFGIMFGKGQSSWHHNMIAHNISRNYRGKVEGTYTMDYVNNVIYDWGYQTAYGTHGHMNYVNNLFKAGNSTKGGYRYFTIDGSNREKYKFYLTGNKIIDNNENGNKVVNDVNDNWNDSVIDYSTTLNNKDVVDSNEDMLQKGYCKTDKPMPIYNWGTKVKNSRGYYVYNPDSKKEDLSVLASKTMKLDTADEAFDKVIAYAGAGVSAESRPPIDTEVMQQAKDGTGTLTGTSSYSSANSSVKATIDKHKIQCDTKYVYPETFKRDSSFVDSDNDGMPDWWEIERGLDPKNASDATGDYCGEGYNNIEYYINDLTVDAFPPGTVTLSEPLKDYVTVDASASEVDGEIFNTLASAMQYVENSSNFQKKDRKIIYVAPGTYNEDISVNTKNIVIMPKEQTTGEIIFNSVNISENAVNSNIKGVTFKGGAVVSGDKSIFKNCNISGEVSLKNSARAYFKECSINSTVSSDSQAIFNECNFNVSDVVAKSTYSDESYKYGILIMNSAVDGNGSAILGKSDGEKGQVVYYNSKISNISDKRFDDVTGKEDNIKFRECKTLNSDGSEADLSSAPKYEQIVTEYDFFEKYSPFKHFSRKNDNWNPDSFDEVTPQTSLQNLLDSISVPQSIITADTEVISSFDSDLDAKITWVSSDTASFKDNTIIAGDFGTGIKNITLTAIVSKPGLKNISKEFNVTIGPLSQNDSSVVDFENVLTESELGKIISISKEPTDRITWGVADRDDGKGKAYQVKQIAATDPPDTTNYSFYYKFPTSDEKVVETDFDVLVGDITAGGYFEIFLRGKDAIGQIRISDDTVNAYTGIKQSTAVTNDVSKWLKVKMIISTVGRSNNVEPKADYYIYDENGNELGSVLGSKPEADFENADDKTRFIPDRIEFRPKRDIEKCEFFVDNIQFKDLSDIAQQDADALETSYTLNKGDSLPKFGNHLSNISWETVDGQGGIINSDGTINFDKLSGDSVITVKANVFCGENVEKGLGGRATKEEITVNLSNKQIAVTNISISENEINIKEGQVYKLTHNIEPSNAFNKNVTWSSKNTKVATVDKNGVITAVTSGSAIVTAVTEDGGFSAQCNVTVSGTPVTGISLSKNEIETVIGKTYQLKANVEPADASNKNVKWSSNNTEVVTVDNKGVVTAVTSGSAIVTAVTEDGGFSAQCNVTVKESLSTDINVSGITLSDNKIEVIIGETHQLKANIEPADASNKNVKWSSSDENIATVDESGKVKAIAEGEVVITVVTEDGGFSAQCDVIVKDNSSTDINVSGITLSDSEIKTTVGKIHQLKANIEPANASNKNVKWSSSDENIATVDESGKVKAIAEGKAIITVMTEDGGFSAQCNIIVAKNDEGELFYGDVDGKDGINVQDAVLTLEYVLSGKTDGIVKDGVERMKVMGNDSVTAEDVAAILKKAIDSAFEFVAKKK